MFSTSVSFSMDLHFCQGNIKSISFVGTAKSCHDKTISKKVCPLHAAALNTNTKSILSAKNCCENRSFTLDCDQDAYEILVHTASFKFFSSYFIPVLVHPFLYQNEDSSPRISAFYKPPLILRDIPVLKQSFLL